MEPIEKQVPNMNVLAFRPRTSPIRPSRGEHHSSARLRYGDQEFFVDPKELEGGTQTVEHLSMMQGLIRQAAGRFSSQFRYHHRYTSYMIVKRTADRTWLKHARRRRRNYPKCQAEDFEYDVLNYLKRPLFYGEKIERQKRAKAVMQAFRNLDIHDVFLTVGRPLGLVQDHTSANKKEDAANVPEAGINMEDDAANVPEAGINMKEETPEPK